MLDPCTFGKTKAGINLSKIINGIPDPLCQRKNREKASRAYQAATFDIHMIEAIPNLYSRRKVMYSLRETTLKSVQGLEDMLPDVKSHLLNVVAAAYGQLEGRISPRK